MTLLDVQGLGVTLATPDGPLRVVRDLSFAVGAGETLGIVGESGSGKSMTALALIGLLPRGAAVAGRVLFEGRDLLGLDDTDLDAIRGDRIAMVFQEPMSALNPVHTIGDQVAEPLIVHGRADHAAARREAARLLDRVGIARAAERLDAYPHELSGGQRQRVMLAMALACRPALLVADEPTSALDVTVQAALIELLKELRRDLAMAMVVISHDLAVIAGLADRTLVLYAGAAMEQGPTRALLRGPRHPYTADLIGALPGRRHPRGTRLAAIPGTIPPPRLRAPGCPYHGRCRKGDERCRAEPPPAVAVGEGHTAWCWHPEPGP